MGCVVEKTDENPREEYKTELQHLEAIRDASKSSNREVIFPESETLKAENDTLKAENQTLKAENESLIKVENETLKAENESLKAENETLKAENESVNGESLLAKAAKNGASKNGQPGSRVEK